VTRERWMIGAIAFLVFVLVAVGIVLLAGGDDDKNISASATTSTTATTLPPTTITQSPPVTIGIICTTAEEASMSFIDSWIAGDQAAAARCATGTAVTTIFESSGAGAQYTFQGCFGDPGVPDCAYTYEGGAVHLAVSGTEATGWKVQSVSYVAD